MAGENNILESFPNNPDIGAEIDKSMLSQSSIPGYTERLLENQKIINQPDAIGPQGAGAYPGMGHNINVGSSSGSMIGNQPIFVPGGNVFATDPILARRKAIDDAAKLRAQSLQKMTTPESYKLQGEGVRLQEKLDNSFFSEIKKLQDQAIIDHGNDAAVVLGDRNTDEGRRMFDLARSYNDFGANADLVATRIAKMDEALQDKSLIFSKEALKLRDEYKNLAGEIFGGETFNPSLLGKLAQIESKLEGHMTLQKYLNDEVKWEALKGKATANFSVRDNGEYYKSTTNEKVSFKEVREAVYNEALKDFDWAIQQGIYTPEEIKSTIDARLLDQQDQSGTITKKNEDAIDRSELSEVKIDPTRPREHKIGEYNSDGTPSGKTSTYKELYYAGITGAKIIDVDSPELVNGANRMRVSGNVSFTPIGMGVISNGSGSSKVVYGNALVPYNLYVDGSGNSISEDQYTNLKDTTIGTVKGKDSYGKQTKYIQQDVTIPLDETIQVKMGQAVNKGQFEKAVNSAEKVKSDYNNRTGTFRPEPKKQIKNSEVKIKAKASGYTEAEYRDLLKQNGVEIIN